MATAKDVLAIGEALAGENEAVTGQNNTAVNKYYNWPGAAYCGGFVKYCMEKAGCTLLAGCGNPWLVSTLRQYMDSKGWKVTGPRSGDIFILGSDEHTGFVDEVLSGGYILRLEGNWGHVYATKDQAKNRTGTAYEGIGYYKSSASDLKFYRPPYEGAGLSDSSAAEPASGAGAVEAYQKWLGVAPDGIYGSDTRTASLERMLLGLLSKYPLKQNASGDAVRVLQGLLCCQGYDPQGMDGEYGPNTAAAVKAYQQANGMLADGEAGSETVAGLLAI